MYLIRLACHLPPPLPLTPISNKDLQIEVKEVLLHTSSKIYLTILASSSSMMYFLSFSLYPKGGEKAYKQRKILHIGVV